MKDLHSLINELGARFNENDKEEAMMILNQMFLDGYDDLFICIALIRVLARNDFERNRYLFCYQPFIDEVNELKIKFIKVKDFSKDCSICAFYDSSEINDYDRALIDEYNDIFNNSDDEESKQKYLDYLYMKYCFSFSYILDCNIKKFKKIVLGTNE